MAEARSYQQKDREVLLSLMAEAYGEQAGEAHFDGLISGSVGIWLASSSEGGPAEGFCRLVQDEETRARRRACMDLLFVQDGKPRLELGRALIDAVRAEAAQKGLDGVWGYFTDPLGRDFLRSTEGEKLRDIRLYRREKLDELSPPQPPEGYQLRSLSVPDDLEYAAALYNDTFLGMWNFRPHSPEDIAAWFEGRETTPEDCLILESGGEDTGEAEGGGIAVLAVDPERVERSDLTAYVPDIGVTPAHRRQGLGRVLMTAIAERARSRGLTAIELIADDEDPAAKNFYRSLGFDEMGKITVYEW
ncbi:GNAT family N-acetyltransferase [Nitrospinota bacterium]